MFKNLFKRNKKNENENKDKAKLYKQDVAEDKLKEDYYLEEKNRWEKKKMLMKTNLNKVFFEKLMHGLDKTRKEMTNRIDNV